ncbi:MAG: hypothetical protein RIR31_497 [Bacteroidota bacterium]
MIKKYPSFFLCFLFITGFHFNILSQALYPVLLDEKIEQSTLIVEGKVVEKTAFWNPAHTMIFTSNKIRIYKVFKGELRPQYIEVMTQGGSVGLESVEVSDLLTLEKDEIGIFFCYPNSISLKNPVTNNLIWDVYSSAQGFFRYDLAAGIADAPFAKFSNILNELYPKLENRIGHAFAVTDASFQINSLTPGQPTTSFVASISSFSPATVTAGATIDAANNLLTISGSDFGTASGSAAILFDDANNGTGGTAYTVAYNDPLIVSWSSTAIQVQVPARVGTGTFQVRDDLGNVSAASAVLNVSYGVLTATLTSGSTVTKESNLMNTDGLGGYSILYSTSTAGGGVDLNASATKATFQRALNTWKEVAGYNVTEAGTTSIQTLSGSDANVIMFDNTNTGQPVLASGVLAVCYSWNTMCTPVTTNAVQKVGFDIVLRNSGVSTGSVAFTAGPCFPSTSTTEYDMETVILHELGHALNLAHINDGTEGSFLPNINPGKLMNYAVSNGVDRRSPDWSALTGAAYCIIPQGNTYGSCGLYSAEMTTLATTTESKDECPVTFPGTATASGTAVTFDLNHATSNKNNDPQYTALNCSGTGSMVTNTAYYALKTNNDGGILTITVSGYATTPVAQAACSGAGVQLALYQTASCPTGQAFPSPTVCRTFNADGALSNITGLAANTTYLLMVTGLSNTKANFTLTLTGAAVLPVKISSFNGTVNKLGNMLNWKLESISSVDKITLEASFDGNTFSEMYTQNITSAITSLNSSFNDKIVAPLKYYRLKILNRSGAVEYSNILLLKQTDKPFGITISPNPVKDKITVTFYKSISGNTSFKLLDISGKVLSKTAYQLTAGGQSLQLDIPPGLQGSIYLLEINDAGVTTSHKIIVY